MITDEMVEAACEAFWAKRAPCADSDRSFADQIRAALEAAERVAWQPIATAPRDGSYVLCQRTGNDQDQAIVCWYSEGEAWITEDSLPYFDDSFSHWRPLPAPPGAA